jgi:hypothetical protein
MKNITEVRRSVLKDKCEDQLNIKTGGEYVDYGGSFDRYLKELEEEKALEIIQKSKKKTIIVPNITRVKQLLVSKRLSGLLDESTPHFIEEEIQQEMWEKIIESEVGMTVDDKVKELVQRSTLSRSFEDSMINKSHPFMMEVTKKIASPLASMLYHFFYVSHKKDDGFQLDERTIMDLGILARRLAYMVHILLWKEFRHDPIFLSPNKGLISSFSFILFVQRKEFANEPDQLTSHFHSYLWFYNCIAIL